MKNHNRVQRTGNRLVRRYPHGYKGSFHPGEDMPPPTSILFYHLWGLCLTPKQMPIKPIQTQRCFYTRAPYQNALLLEGLYSARVAGRGDSILWLLWHHSRRCSVSQGRMISRHAGWDGCKISSMIFCSLLYLCLTFGGIFSIKNFGEKVVSQK